MDYQIAYEVFVWWHLTTNLNIHSIIEQVWTLALFSTGHVWLVGRVCYHLCVVFTAFSVQRGSDSTVSVDQQSGEGLPPRHNPILTSPTQPAGEAPLPHAPHLCPALPPPPTRTWPHPSAILISTRLLWLAHLYTFQFPQPPLFKPLSLSFCSSFRDKHKGWRQRWREGGEVEAKVLEMRDKVMGRKMAWNSGKCEGRTQWSGWELMGGETG